MKTTTLFRALVVAAVLLEICAAMVDSVFPALVPEPLRRALNVIAEERLVWQDYAALIIGVPVVLGFIVAIVGLLRFSPWAPRLALYVTLATLVLYAFVRAEVFSPVSALLAEAAALSWGAALAMAFLPPLNERFRRR